MIAGAGLPKSYGVALHLTKIAYGIDSVDHLAARLKARHAAGNLYLDTRYLPKRHAEIAGQGSLYWIIKHQLVARSAITGFGELSGGRTAIQLDPDLILVHPQPKRAHQGWRYLEAKDAPEDLGGANADAIRAMPPRLIGTLNDLALL